MYLYMTSKIKSMYLYIYISMYLSLLGLVISSFQEMARFQDFKLSRFQDFKFFLGFKISNILKSCENFKIQDFQDFKDFKISRFSEIFEISTKI